MNEAIQKMLTRHAIRRFQDKQLDEGINKFHSVKENFDNTYDSPISRLMIHIFSSLAEWEHAVILDRQRALILFFKSRFINSDFHFPSVITRITLCHL